MLLILRSMTSESEFHLQAYVQFANISSRHLDRHTFSGPITEGPPRSGPQVTDARNKRSPGSELFFCMNEFVGGLI